MLNRMASLIDAHVRADTRKPFSYDEFDAAMAHMRDFLATLLAPIRRHAGFVKLLGRVRDANEQAHQRRP